jgi:uncharacterized protein YigA (DUF484 family)
MSGARESEAQTALRSGEGAAQAKTPTGLGRVRDFLIAKPELIREDEALMRALGVRLIAANVVDFGPAALARVEQARQRETTARQEIEQVAKANFAAQAETHAVVVDLLEARNNADLARRVNAAAVERFGLAAGAIAAEGPGAVPTGWRVLPTGFTDLILGPEGLARLGPVEGGEELFGEAAGRVRSMALLRMAVWPDGRPCILAFGSSEPDGFRSDMGAELVAFLARVVERTAERWPPV